MGISKRVRIKRGISNRVRTKRVRTKRVRTIHKSKNFFSSFFDKIFVINLFDHIKKWFKVRNQFKKINIDVERFVAVDGRCKSMGNQACIDKMKAFCMSYDVSINPIQKNQNNELMKLKEILPVSSLSIGTLILLRNQVKHKWKHMLICEDDIELTKQIEHKFKEGIKQLGNKSWDLLYLGCGGLCGNKGLSVTKDKQHKYSSLYTLPGIEYIDELYLEHPNDLRMYCEDKKNCRVITQNITKINGNHGGTWCYAWSLQGAKKYIKYINKRNNIVSQHVDQTINDFVRKGAKAYSFNPVIVHHELIEVNRKTDIPWKW